MPEQVAWLYADESTRLLARYVRTWNDFQKMRKARVQQGFGEDHPWVTALVRLEEEAGREVAKLLRRHPLWSWLSQFPGLGGVHVAKLLSGIRHPLRFPGQPCGHGHLLPTIFPVETPCPLTDYEGVPCSAPLGPPRPGTGVRSLWHFLGLHCGPDGKAPYRRRGVQADWNGDLRASLLMRDFGIAAQIVRHKVEPYQTIYRTQKARLTQERGGVALVGVSENFPGTSQQGRRARKVRGRIDGLREIEDVSGPAPRPFQLDDLARKIAVKAFVGDLLVEWKRRVQDQSVQIGPVAPPGTDVGEGRGRP